MVREIGNIQEVELNESSSTVFISGSSKFDFKSSKGFAIVAAVNFNKSLSKISSISLKNDGDFCAVSMSTMKNPEVVKHAEKSTVILLVGCVRNVHCLHYADGEFLHLVNVANVFGGENIEISCVANYQNTGIIAPSASDKVMLMDLSSTQGKGTKLLLDQKKIEEGIGDEE